MALIIYEPVETTKTGDDPVVANTSPVPTVTITNAAALHTEQVHDKVSAAFSSQSPEVLQYLDLQFGDGSTDSVMGGFGLINHNMRTGCEFRVLLSNTAYGNGGVLTVTYTNFTTVGSAYQLENYFYDLGANYTFKYGTIRLYMYDPAGIKGSGDAAYLNQTWSIGKLHAGRRASIDAALDLSVGVQDSGTLAHTRSGDVYARFGSKKRSYGMRFYGSTDAAFYGTDGLLDIAQAAGTTGRIAVLPRSNSDYEKNRLGVYGNINTDGDIRVRDKGANGYLTEKTMHILEAS